MAHNFDSHEVPLLQSMSLQVTWGHVTSRQVTSLNLTFPHITSRHRTSPHVILPQPNSRNVTWLQSTSCHVTLRRLSVSIGTRSHTFRASSDHAATPGPSTRLPHYTLRSAPHVYMWHTPSGLVWLGVPRLPGSEEYRLSSVRNSLQTYD